MLEKKVYNCFSLHVGSKIFLHFFLNFRCWYLSLTKFLEVFWRHLGFVRVGRAIYLWIWALVFGFVAPVCKAFFCNIFLHPGDGSRIAECLANSGHWFLVFEAGCFQAFLQIILIDLNPIQRPNVNLGFKSFPNDFCWQKNPPSSGIPEPAAVPGMTDFCVMNRFILLKFPCPCLKFGRNFFPLVRKNQSYFWKWSTAYQVLEQPPEFEELCLMKLFICQVQVLSCRTSLSICILCIQNCCRTFWHVFFNMSRLWLWAALFAFAIARQEAQHVNCVARLLKTVTVNYRGT